MSRWAAAWVLMLLSLVGCSADSGGNSGKKVLRIAVIPKGTSHDFWYSVHAGVKKAADEHDEIEVTWKGPVSEGNTSDQISIMEGFIADGYDGICLAPLDAVALRKTVDQAIAAGIPVVIFDSGLEDNSGVVSFVATNNYRGGQVGGEYLAEVMEGKGQVILMRYALNSLSTEEREKGFLDALAKHPEIELLSADKYAGPDESGAVQLAENLLANFSEQVDGIFCPNQSTASGMLTALGRAGLAGKVKFVGFDAGENIAQGIAAGQMDGAVLQDPVQMGYDTVRVMFEHLSGAEVPARVETQEVLATVKNQDDEKVRALLHPEAVD